MPNMLHSGDLIASIQTDLADNNAGLISALDVRHNIEDVAFSIHHMVASGDTNTTFPFFSGVRSSKADATTAGGGALTNTNPTNGDFIAESGMFFPNCDTVSLRTVRQTEPWPGVASLDHGELDATSLTHDDHLIYYNRNGARPLTGNMSTMDGSSTNVWISASGTENVGLKFLPKHATDITQQEILVSGMGFRFGDESVVPNGKGNAKAWCHFNASGIGGHLPEINAWHNISGIHKKAPGKFKITFTSGTFENNNFVAMATSNGTNASGNLLDMETNTVACIARSGDDGTSLRSVTLVVRDEGGSYVDSAIINFLAYGYSPGEASGAVPTVVDEFAGTPTF